MGPSHSLDPLDTCFDIAARRTAPAEPRTQGSQALE
jgi:hypothetical protein